MRKVIVAGAAAMLVPSIAACPDRASSALTTPARTRVTAAAVPTATAPTGPGTASASTGADAAERKRVRAAWDAGKPATDLVWRTSKAPASWTKLPKTEDGKQKWFVKPGCYVTLWQLDGVRSSKTSKGVLELMAESHSDTVAGKPKPVYRSRSTIKMTGFVVGINELFKLKMAQAIVDYGKVRTEFVAYRDDDMALTYISSCSTAASFKKVSASDFDTFRDALIAEVTY